MDAFTQPVPAPEEGASRKRLLLIVVIAALVGLVAAAVLLWLYHPYFKEMRVVQEGEERRAILNTLPENPRAKDLTFEERQQLLLNLEAPAQ